MNNQVAVYVRVSTADQSLDSQLRDLREMCKARGWEPVIFEDQGISGAKCSRPGWDACWDGLQKGKYKVLVVHALDRIGRSLPHLVKILSEMADRNLTLVSFRENIDLSTATGRMLASLFALLADWERAMIRERTRAGLRAAKARGSRIGNERSYFDERKASELREKGWGQIKIAKALGVGVGRINRWVKETEAAAAV